MSTLERIASALGISVAALVAQTATGFAQRVRRDETPTIPMGPSAVAVRALTSRDALMKVTEIVGSFPVSDRMSHPGEEVVYVIEGEIIVDVGGEQFLLGPGDALNFDCSVEHTYRSTSETPPRMLVIAADPGHYASPVDETVYDNRVANGNAGQDRSLAR